MAMRLRTARIVPLPVGSSELPEVSIVRELLRNTDLRSRVLLQTLAVVGLVAAACDDSDEIIVETAADAGPAAGIADGSATADGPFTADARPVVDVGLVAPPTDAALAVEGRDSPATFRVGPLVTLPLAASTDPARPFNHSAETTIAARGGHVVVAMINLHFVQPTPKTNSLWRHTSVATSHDGGNTFGAAIRVGDGEQPTDPVLRVDGNGRFWFASWDWSTEQTGGLGSLWASDDDGDTWSPVIARIPIADKQWFAVDTVGKRVLVMAVGGSWAYGFDGRLLASSTIGGFTTGAYFDDRGAHFIVSALGDEDMPSRGDSDAKVFRWAGGESPPVQEGKTLPSGALAHVAVGSAKGFGRTKDARQWIVRATKDTQSSAVVMDLRTAEGEQLGQVPLSKPGEIAFMPGADLDDQGRLHVIYYETSGPTGVLKYKRSLTSDLLRGGFSEAVIVDPNVTPGRGWYPGPGFDEANDRRLREYVDLAVDGTRAHLAWTHSPQVPSRVYTAYVEEVR
jgi:hypothetical protein